MGNINEQTSNLIIILLHLNPKFFDPFAIKTPFVGSPLITLAVRS